MPSNEAKQDTKGSYMKIYTVIGYYESTGVSYAMPQSAVDAYTAMGQAAMLCSEREDLCIVGVIEGVHCLVTPGCDNGCTAFAVDLVELDGYA